MFALGAGVAFIALVAFRTLFTLSAGVTLFALGSLFALGAGVTLFALGSLFALGAGCTGVTFIAFWTLFAGVTLVAFIPLEIRVALQGIFIQGYQDAFVSFCAHFFCFQAVAEVKLQAADGRSGYKAAGRVAAAAPLAAAVDVDGQASHTLQLGHVHGVGIRKPGCHARDLAGMGPIAYRNRCPGGFPGLVRQFAGFVGQRIIAFHVFIRNSHGPAAQGHAAIHFHVGIVADEDGVGSRGGQFLIGRTQDYVVRPVGQFVVVAQHQIGFVRIHFAAGESIMGTDHIIVLAVFHFIVEAIHVVQLGGGPFFVFLVAAGHRVAHAHNLSHVSFIHGVAATHDHDLGPAGGNGCLQGLVQLPRVLQALHDGTGFLNVDGPVGIGDAVPGAVDHSRVGIGGHVSLPYDAVGDTAEGLGSAGVVVKVEHTIGKGCRTAEIIAARLSCLIHDAGEGTGYSGGNAARIGHVPGCQTGEFLGPFVIVVKVLGIFFGRIPKHIRCFFIDAVIFGPGLFQLGHVYSIRIFRTSCYARDLTSHVLRSITDGNGSCRRFPSASGIILMVTICRVITNCTLIDNSYRTSTDGCTAVHRGIGIVANHDCIFEVFSMFYWCFSCYFFRPITKPSMMHDCFCFFHRIHRTYDDVIIATIQLVVITNHNGFV